MPTMLLRPCYYMVGRDVPGAPRTRGRQRRRHRGRGPPGTSAPTRGTREHKVPRQPCYYGRARRPRRAAHTRTPAETPSGTRAAGDVGPYQGTREHKVPHDDDHVIMVGRDVPGAPRTRGRQRRRRRDAGRRRRRPLPWIHGKVPHDADHVIMVGRDVPGATRTRGRQRRRRRDAGRRGRRPLPGIHGNTRCRMMMLCVIIGICSFSLESNRVPQNRICPRPHPIGSSAFSHHFILNAKLHGILALPPSSRL